MPAGQEELSGFEVNGLQGCGEGCPASCTGPAQPQALLYVHQAWRFPLCCTGLAWLCAFPLSQLSADFQRHLLTQAHVVALFVLTASLLHEPHD